MKKEMPGSHDAFILTLWAQVRGPELQQKQFLSHSYTTGIKEEGSKWQDGAMTRLCPKNCRHSPVMSMYGADMNYYAVLHGGCGWSVPHRWPHSLQLGHPLQREHDAP